ncbi:ABC transporter substrate-binding protein [Rhizobium rhizosphaerae]|uniref:ABC transporter substrate-binding protein n=1 Tax=Xaviernesmea rhizosphaerae TaxID=1672749 RepID=A0A1Q9AHD4_9HYPH|nr:ABC transporter substrate-binding protein [Xaviernesmea rhizosphaerae]OLP54666.1 ABC transporter substrate-binding protein [Xaviernesmea rhizosphaerae]
MTPRDLFCTIAMLLGATTALAQEPLRVVTPFEIASLEPSRGGFNFTRMEVAETLVGADDEGRAVPGLSTAWTLSDDRLTWRFTLRARAKFHDDTPVTAEIVAQCLERARSQPGPLKDAPLTEIRAVAPDVVEIATSTPFMPLPAFLAESSSQILAPSSYDETGAVRRIIGSGPYRITSLEPPLRFEVERFEGWTGGAKPAIERAIYQAVGRKETRALMAESGQADLAFTLDPAGTDRLRRAAGVAVTTKSIPRVITLKLNAHLPAFADVRVRRAVSLALDREGIASAILRSPEAAATQFFPPTMVGWHVPGLAPLRHDPAEARRLLAEAGWAPDAQGQLVKDGKPLHATLRSYAVRPELPVVAAAIQAAERDIGIDLDIAMMNSSDIPAGHRDGTLEMGLIARNFSLVPDPIGTMLADFGPHGGDWGAMGWASPQLTETLQALQETDAAQTRAALRGRVSEILQTELPVIPVAWYELRVAASKRLDGVSIDPFELSYRISRMRWAD